MLRSFDKHVLLCAAATCIALAAVAALAADILFGGVSIALKIAAAAAGLATAVTACGLLGRLWLRQQAEFGQFVDQLRQTELHQFGGDVEQLLPQVTVSGPLRDSLLKLRQYLINLSHAYQNVERDRARAEVRHRRSAAQCQQLTEILQGLQEPVLAIDQYDELLLANDAATELFNFDPQSVEQRALGNLVRCEQLVDLLTDTRRRRGPGYRAAEMEVVSDAGLKRHFCATVSSIAAGRDASGDGERGAVAVLRDVSDQKAIQRRHAEFVSSVSHEMKTPLSSIKAYVELLADGDAEDDQTREEFLEVINSQADRLRRLIDNLLNLARIEAGVVNVNKQKRSLNDVLEEAYSVVQPAAEQKKIRLERDLSPMYLGVLIDRDMILQSAINLLSNAVKYTSEGGAVTLRSREVDGRASFEVEDTGVGLSEEDCQKVFDKFYRVKKNRQMAAGTGLGLPLAKHIIEEVHGGQLTLTSVEGQGSTFRVSLPRVGRSGGE